MSIFKLLLYPLLFLSFSSPAAVSDFEENVTEKKVTYMNVTNSSYATLQIMDPIVNLPTTKQYAQYLMDNYKGWDLKAVVDLRGFSFKYVDNAPCSGLNTYFDGRSYLFFSACGTFSVNELTALYKKANESLKLTEILKLQSRPNL